MVEIAKHPAKYSKALVPTMLEWLDGFSPVVDPCAGIASVDIPGLIGHEIEEKWALQGRCPMVVGDARQLPFRTNSLPAVVCSPTYGNRMADSHNARDSSKRNTYRHVLGSPLHPGNTGQIQWGQRYRIMHIKIWQEVNRILIVGGRFVLNCKNHIRKGVEIPVSEWHARILKNVLNFRLLQTKKIEVVGQRQGANGSLRVPYESLMLFEKR